MRRVAGVGEAQGVVAAVRVAVVVAITRFRRGTDGPCSADAKTMASKNASTTFGINCFWAPAAPLLPS